VTFLRFETQLLQSTRRKYLLVGFKLGPKQMEVPGITKDRGPPSIKGLVAIDSLTKAWQVPQYYSYCPDGVIYPYLSRRNRSNVKEAGLPD
jgi:hypothetical protein